MASDRRSITTVLRAETGQYQQAMDSAAKSTAKVGDAASKASKQTDGLGKSGKGLGDGAAAGAKKGESALGRMAAAASKNEQAWQGVGTSLTVAGGAVTAFGAAAVTTGIQYNTLQQTSRAALESILGSAAAANEQMDKLDEFARTSPFAKQTFITAQQQMLAFGIEAQKVIPYLDAIQNAVAAAGGSNDDIAGITATFSKIQSSAKITAEDLNELGNRGVNAAELIGDQMGMTGAQVREAITAGSLDAGQALDALAAGMSERFDGAAANVKNTFSGAMDRVKAAWRDFASDLASPLVDPSGGGALVGLLNWAADAMRAFQALPDPVKDTVSWLTLLGGAATTAVGGLVLLAPKVHDLIGDFKSWLDDMPALKDGLKKIGINAKTAGVLAGVGGAAVAAAAVGLSIWAQNAAEAEARTQGYMDTLDEMGNRSAETGEKITESLTSSTDAWVDGSTTYSDLTKKMGISSQDAIGYILGEQDAVDRVNSSMDTYMAGASTWERITTARSSQVGELRRGLDQQASSLSEAQRRTLQKAQADEALAESEDAASGSVGELASAQEVLAAALESTNPEIASQAEQFKSLIDGVGKAGGAFMDFSDDLGDAGFSLDGWLDKLEKQQKALTNWSDNIATLVKKGASKELLQNLIDQGPAAAKAVEGLANGTEKDLKRAEKAVGGTSDSLTNLQDILGEDFVLELNTVPAQQEGESAAEYISRLSAIIEVNGDAVPAQKDGESAADYISRLKAYIKTNADTRQAKKDGQGAVDYINGLKAIIKSNGNSLPARKDGESTVEYINRLRSMIVIDANGGPAKKDGESTSKYISRLKTMITTSGNSVPARKDGESASAYIKRLKTVMGIDGDNAKAKKSGKDAQKDINKREATIDVEADTDPAKGTIDTFISKARKTVISIGSKFMPGLFGGGTGDGEGAGWSGGTPHGVAAMSRAVKAIEPGARITSGYRPGAVTATGYPSYHGMGRAIDIVSPNMGRTWDKLRAAFGSRAKELFYTPRGFMRNGVMGGAAPVTRRTHYSHVHLALAGGGAARGPGGPTDDKIPAWLSNGEHVLTASDVAKLGGQQKVYQLRDLIQRGELKNLDPEPTFASGGAVGSATRALTSAQRKSSRLARQLRAARAAASAADRAERHAEKTKSKSDDKRAKARSNQADKRVARLEKQVQSAQDAVSKQRERLSRLRTEARDTRVDLRRGDIREQATSGISGAYSVVDQMYELARSGDLSKWQANTLSKRAYNAEKSMRSLYKQADALDKKLESANDRVSELGQIAESVSSSVSGGFKLGEITSAWTGGPATSGKEYLAGAQAYAAKTKAFAYKLRDLQKKGYSGAILQEVASMGVEEGTVAADALLQLNPADTKAMNAAYKQIDYYSGRAGQIVTEGFYKGGLAAANGLVKGLESQQKKIEKQILKIAKSMESALKKALGIKSPSTVFRQLGQYTGAGMVLGLQDSVGAVARASEQLAHVPGTVTPSVYANPAAKAGASQVVAVVDKGAMAEAMNGMKLTLVADGKPITAIAQTTVDRSLTGLATSLNGGRR